MPAPAGTMGHTFASRSIEEVEEDGPVGDPPRLLQRRPDLRLPRYPDAHGAIRLRKLHEIRT